MTHIRPPNTPMTTGRPYQPQFLYSFLYFCRALASDPSQGGDGLVARALLSWLLKNFRPVERPYLFCAPHHYHLNQVVSQWVRWLLDVLW